MSHDTIYDHECAVEGVGIWSRTLDTLSLRPAKVEIMGTLGSALVTQAKLPRIISAGRERISHLSMIPKSAEAGGSSAMFTGRRLGSPSRVTHGKPSVGTSVMIVVNHHVLEGGFLEALRVRRASLVMVVDVLNKGTFPDKAFDLILKRLTQLYCVPPVYMEFAISTNVLWFASEGMSLLKGRVANP